MASIHPTTVHPKPAMAVQIPEDATTDDLKAIAAWAQGDAPTTTIYAGYVDFRTIDPEGLAKTVPTHVQVWVARQGRPYEWNPPLNQPGYATAFLGDWIVRDAAGYLHAYSDEEFRSLYREPHPARAQ